MLVHQQLFGNIEEILLIIVTCFNFVRILISLSFCKLHGYTSRLVSTCQEAVVVGQPLLCYASTNAQVALDDVYHGACFLTVTARCIIRGMLSNSALNPSLYLSASSLTVPCILFRVGDSLIFRLVP